MSFQSKPTEILFAGNVNNMGGDFFTLPGNVTNVPGYSIQAIWTDLSTPVGVMSIQASNDAVNWSDIPNSSLPVGGTNTDTNNIFNVSKRINYNYARLKYVWTSGDATCVISMVQKG